MYLRNLIPALVLTLALVAGAQAFQGGCPGQGHYQDFMSSLTPEQQEKVRKATDIHHERLFALHKELSAKHQAMENLFASTPVDQKSLDKIMAEVNELQANKNKLNADYRLELSEITGKPVLFESGRGCGPRPQCRATSSGAGNGTSSAPCCPSASRT
ncbi:MAG: periplasmic heavy metal sensor [Desulfovibrionales bacterium]|nr:periplasmic heavy metal sensor [Desulfovibrionales bacterium]